MLPVLLYHRVSSKPSAAHPELTVTPGEFEAHLRWLARGNYRSVTSAECTAWRKSATPLPAKPLMITFDDGYRETAHHALPLLRRYGFSATVFIPTNFIGGLLPWDGEPVMNPLEIAEWANDGIEFGAHSRSHADLTCLAANQLVEELQGSADALEAVLGRRVLSFAYPFGFSNAHVQEKARAIFDLCFTCDEGLNTVQTDSAQIRRTMVLPRDSRIDLTCRVRLGWSPLARLRGSVRLRERVASAIGRFRKSC